DSGCERGRLLGDPRNSDGAAPGLSGRVGDFGRRPLPDRVGLSEGPTFAASKCIGRNYFVRGACTLRRSHARCARTRRKLCFPQASALQHWSANDLLIPDPAAIVMHAVTIAAPPERVWPWLVQMGSGRAGWYSYDWVDNDG